MATPHLAGSAAVVLGQHPGWSSAAVRSAVVNTAQENTLKKATGTGVEPDPLVTGNGRERLDNAVNAAVALDPVSLSFGAVPSGSGQSKTGTIALTSLSGLATWTVSIGASTGAGVTYTANIAGGNIVVGMSATQGASKGDHSATLRVMRNGTEVAHAIVYTLIK
jgi:minor extracellular serine protease Vpr